MAENSNAATTLRTNMASLAKVLSDPQSTTHPEHLLKPATKADLGRTIIGVLDTHVVLVNLVSYMAENAGQPPRDFLKELSSSTQQLLDLLTGLLDAEAGDDAN